MSSIKDENRMPEVSRNIQAFCKKTVEVGIFGNENADLPMIYHANEFGATIKVTDKMRGYLGALGLHLKKETTVITIPERSTLRNSFDNNDNIDQVFVLAQNVYEANKDVMQGLTAMGVKMSAFVKNAIISNTPPPNHPFTVEQKGSAKTLVDKGVLLGAIRHEVV